MRVFIGCSSLEDLSKESWLHCQKVIEVLAREQGVDLVLGGASSGLMKLCYEAFVQNGKAVLILLNATRENEQAQYPGAQVVIEKTTFDRTKRCFFESDFALFLDGGSGTLSEILAFREEVRATLRAYPIYFYNENHAFDAFKALLQDGVDRNTISLAEQTAYLEEVKTLEEVQEKIKGCIEKNKEGEMKCQN